MPKGSISIAVMIIGLLLLMVSFFYSPGKHSETTWNEEQALEYSTAAAKVHELSYDRDVSQSDGKTAPPDTPELAEARKKWETSKAQLDDARSGRKRNARILLITGLVLSVGGVIANRVGY